MLQFLGYSEHPINASFDILSNDPTFPSRAFYLSHFRGIVYPSFARPVGNFAAIQIAGETADN
jgi:hypothetical protein